MPVTTVQQDGTTVTIGGKTFRTEPVRVPGIATGIYTAEDALGTSFEVAVPESGIIHSMWSYDIDDEALEFNIFFFIKPFTSGVDHDAWAMLDTDRMLIAGPPLVFDTFKGVSGATWGGSDNVGWPFVAWSTPLVNGFMKKKMLNSSASSSIS